MDMKKSLFEIVRQTMDKFSPYELLQEQLLGLPFNRPIHIFALGSAAYEMAEAVTYHASQEEFIRIVSGLIITRYGNDKGTIKNMKVIEANHLVPDQNSLQAGEEAIEFLSRLNENDVLIVLLSGGGTSLMEKLEEGVSLDILNSRLQYLYNQGAGLAEIDAERKSMSQIKGGKLARYVKTKEIFIYAMSDISNDVPKYICSNPFYQDAEETSDEIGIDYYHRFDNLTTSKFKPQHKSIVYKIVANNRMFCEKLKATAIDTLPYLNPDLIHVVDTEISGQSAKVGRDIVRLAKLVQERDTKERKGFDTPCLLIFGGILNANVIGRGNVGRSTELAMAAVEGLSTLMNCALLVYNTSGTEVFYDVAGAHVDNKSKQALLDKGIDIEASLEKHETFSALKEIDAVIIGRKSTLNVNEVVLLYIQ